jgi:hypothetical protein
MVVSKSEIVTEIERATVASEISNAATTKKRSFPGVVPTHPE